MNPILLIMFYGASKLGENEIASNSVVISQPLLGSVFKSQNTDNWTEDLFEDIKFTIYRAEFDITKNGIVELVNEPLEYEMLDENPFQTDSLSDTTATSPLYKNNNKIIKVNHKLHGFEDTGKSFTSFKNSNDFGGINSTQINNVLHKVSNVGLNSYDIISTTPASANSFGGGNTVMSLSNKKYERLFSKFSYLDFSETSINAEVKTTNILPVDTSIINYQSYSQTEYEKTFLNEEHFFNNQKIICSRINELKNIISDNKNSLQYKLILSSTKSYLSPIIDLRSSGVILSTNSIEKSTGYEDRYGRRNQIIEFYPVYKFSISGQNMNSILVGDGTNIKLVIGNTSLAKGIIVKIDLITSELYVKMQTTATFSPSESLTFSAQPTLTSILVGPTGVSKVDFPLITNSVVTAIDKTNLNVSYENIISGKISFWNSENKKLTVSVNKKPINNNYIAESTIGSNYARIPVSSGIQPTDIFRVNDLVGYENQPTDEKLFLQIKSITYSPGILYVSDVNNNSSSLSKYVTKEISLESPATSIDVRLTANIFQIDDIKILYKINYSTSQYNFNDLSWQYFNLDGNPNEEIIPSPDNLIAGYIENQKSYKEYKYSVSNLQEFTSFAIKIVMKSQNPVFVPKFKTLE